MKNITAIKLNKEFKRAYFSGRFKAHPFLVTYMVKNKLGINRVGITTSKKIGKAHKRNRARRIIRQAYINLNQEYKELLPKNQSKDIADKVTIKNSQGETCFDYGYDIVFVARDVTTKLKTQDIQNVMQKHFQMILNSSKASKSRKAKSKKK